MREPGYLSRAEVSPEIEAIVDWLLDRGDHYEGPSSGHMRGAIKFAYDLGRSDAAKTESK